MTNIINATNRFNNKERKFWKEFSAIDVAKALPKGDLDINQVLEIIWPHTSVGKEKPIRFDPNF